MDLSLGGTAPGVTRPRVWPGRVLCTVGGEVLGDEGDEMRETENSEGRTFPYIDVLAADEVQPWLEGVS